jgi:hypothetical protein
MATVTARDTTHYESDYVAADDIGSRASGWIGFAAIMLGLAGGWNIFDGILALARSKVYAPHATYVFSDLRTWGWIVLAVGIVQVCASFALLAGSSFARWFGISAAGVNAIAQLMFIPAAPFWALAMFSVDLLVIYALAVYGGREVEAA